MKCKLRLRYLGNRLVALILTMIMPSFPVHGIDEPTVKAGTLVKDFFITKPDGQLEFDRIAIANVKSSLGRKRLSQASLTFAETYRLGMCYLVEGELALAATTFENSAGLTTVREQKLLALMMAAEVSHLVGLKRIDPASNGWLKYAGSLADRAQGLSPTNLHIANARVIYWRSVNDKLLERCALSHFERLTSDSRGTETCEPCTVAVIVIGVIMITGVVSAAILLDRGKITPEDAARLLGSVGLMVGGAASGLIQAPGKLPAALLRPTAVIK
jgi:hypothetical protein